MDAMIEATGPWLPLPRLFHEFLSIRLYGIKCPAYLDHALSSLHGYNSLLL